MESKRSTYGVTGLISEISQIYYFELGFTSKVGQIKLGESAEVHINSQSRLSDYTQSNDYSFNRNNPNKYFSQSLY